MMLLNHRRTELPFTGACLVILLALTQTAGCLAQDSANKEALLRTSESEVLFNNPIKLTVSKNVVGGDLPVLSKSLGLEEAIQIALHDNPTLEQSARSWNISKFWARSALGKLGPSASANVFFARSSLNQTLFFMSDTPIAAAPMQNTADKGTLLSVVFAARQPLFTGGRLIGGYRAARAQERQVLSAYNGDRVSTALQVRKAYWEAAFDKAKVRLNSDYVKYRQESVANIQAKVETGKLPKADLLREQAELARAKVSLNESYRDLNIALVNLKALLALNMTSEVMLKDDLLFGDLEHDLNYYLAEATTKRPEIPRARAVLAEMHARRTIALSKYAPQVDLYGLGVNQTGHTPESLDTSVNGQWRGLISIMGGVTLFDSGSRFNDARAANEAVRRAQAAVKEAQIKVSKEVSVAWIELNLAAQNVQLARVQVASAKEDKRLMHARFEVGKAIGLEDFQASLREFEAQVNELEAVYKCRVSEAQLLAASGETL